jgi:hypothetical protein
MGLHWRHRVGAGTVLAIALVTLAAMLAIAVSDTGIARAAGTCTDSWKAAVSGNWSEPAKWSTGSVPSSSDEACITVAGTYTVTAEGSQEVKSLTLGGESGGATLSLRGLGCTTSTYFDASSNITTNAFGTVLLTNANGSCSEAEDVDLSWGGTFANAGKITVAAGTAGGTRELDGSLTNTGSVSVGVNTSSDSTIDNEGSIAVANGAILSLLDGTFTNGTGGSVTDTGTGALELSSGTFNQGAGAAGKVYIYDSTLNLSGAGAGTFAFEGSGSLSGNVAAGQSVVLQGDGCLTGANVTASAGFTNAGSIELTNVEGVCAESEPVTLSWSGTLTNTGTLTSAVGVAGGTRALDGSLTNNGAVNIDSETGFEGSGAVFTNKKTVTVADEAIFYTTGGQTFTDATGGSVTTTSGSLEFIDTIFNVGAGSPGTAPVLLEDSSTLNLAGATAAGTFVFRGSDTMSGSVAAGQSIVLQGVGCVGGADVTAPAGFTNAGSIELTNVRGSCADSQPAQLNWSGTMTNTGTLTSGFGLSGGSRTLDGNLTNSGTVNIDANTSFDGSSALFDNKKTVAITKATLFTSGGQTFDNDTGGSVTTTSGGLSFQDTVFDVGAGSPGLAPVLLSDSSTLNLNGSAAGIFVFHGSDTLTVPSGTVAADQSIVVQGVGCLGGAYLTAPAGFTNAGSIELTNAKGTCADSQPAQLSWSGTITNTGTLTSSAGTSGGSRTLEGNLTNGATGNLNIDAGTTFGSSSQLTNNGTLTIGAGRTFSLQSTTFTQGSGGDLVENIASASGFGKLLNPGGSDALAGKLTLDTASGYSPPRATKFRFMTFTSETGTFASNVVNGHGYSVKYEAAAVTLSALDTTTTTVALSSETTQVENAVTATATVTGPAPSNPTGTISFSSPGSGAFSASAKCTLVASTTAGVSSCSVTYTPSAVETGHTISASYPGDGNYAKSSGASVPLTVTTRTTATTVACTPASIGVNATSECEATVTDNNPGTASTPSGTVQFSSNGSGSFTPASSCTLAAVSTGVASCAVSYIPSTIGTGTHTITAGYGGDVTHATSSGETPLTVTTRTTSTALSCSPANVGAGATTACKATVTDVNAGTVITPTGSVTFSASGTGSFTPGSCTLAAGAAGTASCSVNFSPAAVGTGSQTITGGYAGDANHASSSGGTTVTIFARRSTSTVVSCNPVNVAVGVASSCKATVTDTAAGTATTPVGTVKFTTSGSGSFTPASSCTLAAVSTGVASCTVSYTPTALGTGTHTITAAYGGDAGHATSSGNAPVMVSTRTTTTTLECNPTSVATGVGSSCKATVSDTNAGTVSTPTGTVSFSSNGMGSFSASSCTLAATSMTGVASCSVTYTPSAMGNQTITGDYGGDSNHASSTNGTPLTVT